MKCPPPSHLPWHCQPPPHPPILGNPPSHCTQRRLAFASLKDNNLKFRPFLKVWTYLVFGCGGVFFLSLYWIVTILLLFCLRFFGCEVRGVPVPRPGIKPAPPALGGEVSTTGPPGKSQVQGFWNTNPKEADFHWAFSICSIRLPVCPGTRKHEHEIPWRSACVPDSCGARASVDLPSPGGPQATVPRPSTDICVGSGTPA